MGVIAPCGALLFILAVSGGTAWWLKRRYIDPLAWRIRQLEREVLLPRTPQPVTAKNVQRRPAPRRYTPVEQQFSATEDYAYSEEY